MQTAMQHMTSWVSTTAAQKLLQQQHLAPAAAQVPEGLVAAAAQDGVRRSSTSTVYT
jgi:hypothetical protein